MTYPQTGQLAAQTDQLAALAEFPPADVNIRFRPGPGGTMTGEWAAYMLNQWWTARDKKLSFAEAVKRTTVHFMVGEDEL